VQVKLNEEEQNREHVVVHGRGGTQVSHRSASSIDTLGGMESKSHLGTGLEIGEGHRPERGSSHFVLQPQGELR
jgi:hypothetical protein